MSDEVLLKMEGRWYLQYSGCPLWTRPDVSTVSFYYKVQHKGEVLIVGDRVEYKKKGRMRFRLGYDTPVQGIAATFRWRGKGVNRTFRKHFEVTILKEEYMVLFFEKTLTSPTSIDVVTRKRNLSAGEVQEIFAMLREDPTVKDYVKDLLPVRQS
ncbi:hypothetical protein ABB02_00427 [Clostridiaceae bacterium JG1575]|nr:hypothetical protein ABB02_00427 [Clostridiaceae bacterium JG1575]